MNTRQQPSIFATAFWWTITIVTLIVVDDLTFGPVFWVLSRVAGQTIAVICAFTIYVSAQLFLIWQATSEHPHRYARWFLERLRFDRRWRQVHEREQAIHRRIVGALSAILISPVIGGVLPPVVLYLGGMGSNYCRRVGVLTSVIYASEFAFLHGWVPGTI